MITVYYYHNNITVYIFSIEISKNNKNYCLNYEEACTHRCTANNQYALILLAALVVNYL